MAGTVWWRPRKTEADVEVMQNNLDTLYRWESDNNMLFNGSKFQILRYGQNELIKEETVYFTPNI